MGISRAIEPINTQYIKFDNKVYCAYCGKELKVDREWDDYEVVGEYYHCDCKEALLEKTISEKINAATEKISEIYGEISKLRSSLPKKHYDADDFIRQIVLKDYKLTEAQINDIKKALSACTPQKEFFEDLIFGCPNKTCSGFVISEFPNRTDMVNINLGYYEDSNFYFYPVRNGVFTHSKLIHGNIIGIIPFNNKKKGE